MGVYALGAVDVGGVDPDGRSFHFLQEQVGVGRFHVPYLHSVSV
jgi:hypothetical protein